MARGLPSLLNGVLRKIQEGEVNDVLCNVKDQGGQSW